MTTPNVGQLAGVEFFSGVNEALQPFTQVRAFGSFAGPDGTWTLMGQMSPDELRGMALQMLAVAESAVMDAAVTRFLHESVQMELDTALTAVSHLRHFRADMADDDDTEAGGGE